MKFFYDIEFIDDGKTIDLLSIGVVAGDGREYYAVNADLPERKLYQHKWLCDNVLPYLPMGVDGRVNFEHPNCKPSAVIATEVRDFLLSSDDEPELWAWYAAYDHVCLAQMWGPMTDLPPGIPMFTMDLKQEHVRQGCPDLPEQDALEHHALADARYNVVIAKALGIAP
jgi:hypothetical protein